ncbi:MAG TPA: urease accessory protein, partial [Burkholderiaceae bacterium]|nr:urease accessory protein [Burkholderiaceae bacterium]
MSSTESAATATWHARLELAVRLDDNRRCVVHAAHQGPLRVLKTLYPEGDGIAHQVLVHPPGGIVGGDRLDIT